MADRAPLHLRGAGLAALIAGSVLLGHQAAFTAPGHVQAAPPIGGLRPGLQPRMPIVPPGQRPPAPQPTPPSQIKPKPVLPAEPPPGDAIMPVSEVKAGMKGYGLTVFHGTKIERFDVEILGVLPKTYMGESMILVKLAGGPISERGAFLIHGMSGSPIYVNGKLLGAFSMGNDWPKEPIGMVTPIQSMMEALDPKLSSIPAGQMAGNFNPVQPDLPVASTLPGLPSLLQTPPTGAAALGSQFSFHPLSLPVMVSGLSPRNLERAAEALKPFNMMLMQGPGSMEKRFSAELKPGAGIGVALLSGDIDMTSIGTVTYRKGDQLLAFGHPMMQIGAAQFPITTAYIHEVFPGFNSSSKIGSAGPICGTLTQDRPFSVAGKIGPAPQMIPIHCVIHDKSTGRAQTFNVRAANHPLLVGQLLPIAVNQALYSVRPVPGDTVADVKLTAVTDGAGTITRENLFYDPAQIDLTAIRELQELMQILNGNNFRRIPVKSLDVDVTYEDKLPAATVDRIFLSQDRVEPGDEVNVGVVLRPYRKQPVVLKTRIKVPESAANGTAVLMVQGGATRVNLQTAMTQGAGGQTLPASISDANLEQTLRRWKSRERNNQLAVRLIFPSTAVNVSGDRLSQLPPHIVDVMRSGKSTGFRIERDETKQLQDTDYIVQGLQTLSLTVERKNYLERPRGAEPHGALQSDGASAGAAGGAPGNSLSAGDGEDPESLSTLRFTVDGQPRTLHLQRYFTPELEELELERKEKEAEKAAKGGKASHSAAKPARDTRKDAPAEHTAAADSGAAAAKPAAAEDAKIVGRQALIWTQTSQSDFERGKLQNAAVTTSGEVRLAPGLQLVHETDQQFVWSVVAANGALYAGTGSGGEIVKIDAQGNGAPFFKSGELEIHALARDAAGNLYAGTSPNGKLFRVSPDGKGTELLSMNQGDSLPENGGKFVLALATAEDGTVYAGTGPTGQIYRVRPGADRAELYCTLPTKSVTTLLAAPGGKLYAGTADDGAIYRVENGAGTIVYDSDQAAITGLALDRAGNLYAASAPAGEIFRIDREGTPRVYYSRTHGNLYGLQIDPAGNLYTCTANTLLRIEPNGSATLLADHRRAQFTSLVWDDQGHLVAGSANMGGVYRLTPAASGSFESTIHDAKLPARWGRVRFTGVAPANSALKIETRSGNTPVPDGSWSAWQEPHEDHSSLFVSSPEARFLQYRVLFTAQSGAPALRDISIAYLPRNQAPRLTLAFPLGGEILKGTQTFKWSAVDPDGDTLTYDISYSADGGRTWKAVGEKTGKAETTAPVAGSATPQISRSSAEEALQRYKATLDKDPSLTPAQRDEMLNKARAMVDRFVQGSGAPAADAASPAAPAPGSPTGSTRQASIQWDTKSVPDGVYLIRVTASDRASNPSDALSDTKTSEPLVVCNTPPQLFVFEKGITVNPDRTASVTGVATGRVAVKGAQYRIGSGEWTAIDAEDGLWDGPFESFRFTIPAAPSGEQTVEVKVVDVAGNVSTTKVRYRVP